MFQETHNATETDTYDEDEMPALRDYSVWTLTGVMAIGVIIGQRYFFYLFYFLLVFIYFSEMRFIQVR